MSDPSRRRVALLLVPAIVVAACGGASLTGAPAMTTPSMPVAAATPSSPPPGAVATPSPAVAPPGTNPVAATRADVDRLAAAVEADPADPDAQRALGEALLQLVRETLDPSLYAAAERALLEADRLRPDDARTLAALGGLHLGRHEFATALELGTRAVELSPTMPAAHAVVVDALVELGRYDEAEVASRAMLAAGEDVGTLARASNLRELHGDLEAARVLMARAADLPDLAPEHRAFALSILGNLERWTGDPDGAEATWNRALALVPDHPPSLAGLARLALGRGDPEEAERLYERAAAVVPLPEYVVALGELQALRGDAAAAAISLGTAAAEIQLQRASGVVVDVDLALFEADHGDPRQALEQATAGWDATPTVRAADAAAWALHRLGRDDEAADWSRRALALGTRDPLLRYHAGAIAAANGRVEAARRHLELALETDPGFAPAAAADAARLLDALRD